MLAGLYDSKEKVARIQLNDELSIELYPAGGPELKPLLKLCRNLDKEQQALTIYLKEIPMLIDVLPKAVAQLMALGADQRIQRSRFRQMENMKIGLNSWHEKG
jgi:hypothetical protein